MTAIMQAATKPAIHPMTGVTRKPAGRLTRERRLERQDPGRPLILNGGKEFFPRIAIIPVPCFPRQFAGRRKESHALFTDQSVGFINLPTRLANPQMLFQLKPLADTECVGVRQSAQLLEPLVAVLSVRSLHAGSFAPSRSRCFYASVRCPDKSGAAHCLEAPAAVH